MDWIVITQLKNCLVLLNKVMNYQLLSNMVDS